MKTFIFAFAFFVAATVGSEAIACDMDLNGKYVFQQGGQFLITFQLVQIGSDVSGVVSYKDGEGNVDGNASARAADLIVKWSNGQVGRYMWSIDSNGKLKSGISVDVQRPESKAKLESDANFCR